VSKKSERASERLESLRPDLATAAGRLGRRLGDPRDLGAMAGSLGAGETVRFLAKGSFQNSSGMVLLTDARLLFFFSGVVQPGLEVHLGAIGSVSTSSGLSTGQVTCDVAGEEKPVVLARIVKADVEPLVHAIRLAVEAAPAVPAATGTTPAATIDPFEALAKLAALKDSGVLTEEEFTAKKQQLLDRL
jgi:Short C-terminal domain/Bacterial PH domain